jgi:hypothetical protein
MVAALLRPVVATECSKRMHKNAHLWQWSFTRVIQGFNKIPGAAKLAGLNSRGIFSGTPSIFE